MLNCKVFFMSDGSIRSVLLSALAVLSIQGCANSSLISSSHPQKEVITNQALSINGNISSYGIGHDKTRQAQHFWYSIESDFDRFGKSFDVYRDYCETLGLNFERVDYSRPETVQYGCITGTTIRNSIGIEFVLWASPRITESTRQYHYFVSHSNSGIRPERFYSHALWYGRYNRSETNRSKYEKDQPRPWIPTQLIRID